MAPATRREFLRTTAVAAGGALLAGACGDAREGEIDFVDDDGSDLPDQTPIGPNVNTLAPLAAPESTPAAPRGRYALGVASGDLDSAGSIVWTRYTPLTRYPLRVGVWEMNGTTYVRQVVDAAVKRSAGGYVQADVALPPDKTYRYCFFEMDGTTRLYRSPIGTLHAAPSTARVVTVAAMSCTKQGFDLATIARAAARPELDLFMLLGDTTYADPAVTRAEYRAKWAENLGSDAYKALRAHMGVVATWDDHEVANNWDPETIDPTQLAAASAAFLETLPVRRDATAPGRVWRKVSYGPTLDVFVLDLRGERRKSQNQLVSRAQLDWLEAGLLGSQAAFKLVLSSVPISDFPWVFDTVNKYRWTGYPAQRSELLGHIEQNGIKGVFFLAGDFHLGSAGRAEKSGVGASVRELLCGPGAQNANPLWTTLGANFDFKTGTNNYTVLRLDPAAAQARVTFYDGSDRVLFDRVYPA